VKPRIREERIPLPVAGKRREREPLAPPGDHRGVEREIEEGTEPAHDGVRFGDEVLEADDGDVRHVLRVRERDPVRVRPVLRREPELLLGREHGPVRRPLAPDRAVAPAVRVPDDEDEERIAALEVGGEQRYLQRVRVRLVEEARAAWITGVNDEVLAEQAPEALAVGLVRVLGGVPVEPQERVAGVGAVVVRAEERVPEVVAELAPPERSR
jgi:hypothetical protein